MAALLIGGPVSAFTADAADVAGVPASKEIAFTVLRDGSEIGTHVLRFADRGDDLTVHIETDIAVKIPLVNIAVYRFTHRGDEVWQGGKLSELASETNDDGTEHKLTVRQDGADLHVESDVDTHASNGDIIPASLWNPKLVQQSILLNTLDGTEMPISVEDLGPEQIDAAGSEQTAEHYRLTGGLSREVWYNDRNELIRVRFAGKDNSQIEYILE
ncbi:hypothetical protein HH303_03760 [Rhodospirillaceae bacterium KN72]|uniref:DUF3108 domain-containing protein n=1 Tax=Pacificispira spongiicola TaxID=2729598 RepID=A0A7Y0HDE3_9PROT|nr:DUF6134 family protein [Pacificispira spongiicola]NMM43580.1 hypothetical protein [Pacificispira spongiicola]